MLILLLLDLQIASLLVCLFNNLWIMNINNNSIKRYTKVKFWTCYIDVCSGEMSFAHFCEMVPDSTQYCCPLKFRNAVPFIFGCARLSTAKRGWAQLSAAERSWAGLSRAEHCRNAKAKKCWALKKYDQCITELQWASLSIAKDCWAY